MPEALANSVGEQNSEEVEVDVVDESGDFGEADEVEAAVVEAGLGLEHAADLNFPVVYLCGVLSESG